MEYNPQGSLLNIGVNSEMEELSHFHIIELSNLTVSASLPGRLTSAKNRFLRMGPKI